MGIFVIIDIEMLVAVQGIEYHTPFKTSPLLQFVIRHLRHRIKILEKYRYMASDFEKICAFMNKGYFLSVLSETIFPLL
ncbi:hypothetical protein O99_00339 [Bartonella rochalimae ATCC BAA-1498]|uniref:Uncharacterized protein n=1 Tax=Bartonella rochalimae ATCC BAA-1498 TaxID=685782 RepID=A0A067WLV8_9HYPH|nr:hypothetical protein O99_00339 [Bartonella rochalimae ATCC BAA-1498]